MSQDDGKSISPPKEEGGARVQKPAPVVTVEILDAEQVLVAARAKAAEIAERKTRLAELQVVVDALPVTLRDIHYHLDVVVEVYNTRLGEIIKQIDEYSALFLQVNTVNGPEIEKPVMARLLFGELPATADNIPDHNLQILQAWVEKLERELAEAKKEFGDWISPEEHQTQMAGVVNEALKDSEEAQDLLEKRCARVEKERDEAVARAEEAEVETKRLGGDRDYWRGLSPDFHGSGEELTPTDQAEEVAEEAEEAPPPYWLQQDLDEEAEPVPVVESAPVEEEPIEKVPTEEDEPDLKASKALLTLVKEFSGDEASEAALEEFEEKYGLIQDKNLAEDLAEVLEPKGWGKKAKIDHRLDAIARLGNYAKTLEKSIAVKEKEMVSAPAEEDDLGVDKTLDDLLDSLRKPF